jgi:hypothetical protein
MVPLALSVAALVAFAVPTVAGAAQLTNEKGENIGGTMSMTSTNTVMVTSLGTLRCEHVEFSGVVATNGGGGVAIGMDGTNDTMSGCALETVLVTSKVSITPTFETLKASGTGPGHVSFTFNEAGICTAAATEAGSTVTWNGTDVIHITAATTGSCGNGTVHADFTLFNGDGSVIAEN